MINLSMSTAVADYGPHTLHFLSKLRTYLLAIVLLSAANQISLAQSPPNSVCGNILNFDGIDDFVDMGNTLSPNVITLEAWVKVNSLGGVQHIFDRFNSYELQIRPGGEIRIDMSVSGNISRATTARVILANKWQHIATSFDGFKTRIYVDGALILTKNGSVSGSLNNSGVFLTVGNGLDGFLDEVRVWNVVRSELEIQTNMGTKLTGTEPNLIAYWDMDQGVGTDRTLVDRSITENHGELMNMDETTPWMLLNETSGGNTISETITETFESSFDWNGNTYNQSGIYFDPIIPNNAGCDSLRILNLTLLNQSPNLTCGTVLNFDGIDDKVEFGNAVNPSTVVTMEAWFRTESLGINQTIIGKLRTPGAAQQYHLQIQTDGKMAFGMLFESTTNPGFTAIETARSQNKIKAKRWYHIAGTYDGTDMKLYIDGKHWATRNKSSSAGNVEIYSTPLTLSPSTGVFEGSIDEVRMWDVARSQIEIQNNKDIQLIGNEANLVGYWNMDQGIGSGVATDQTVNGNDGVLINMDTQTDWEKYDGPSNIEVTDVETLDDDYTWNGNTYTEGGTYTELVVDAMGCDKLLILNLVLQQIPPNATCGTVLNFNGVNQYVDMGNVLNPTSEITLEAWFKTNALGVRQGIIGKPYTSNGEPYYQYHTEIRADGKIYFAISLNGSRRFVESTKKVVSKRWYHLAARYDGSVIELYVDGELWGSKNVTGNIDAYNTSLHLGASSGFELNGSIAEARIWDVARSETEIQNNKDVLLTGSETNLIGYWDLDQGQGSISATDLTSNENHGVLTNMDESKDWTLYDGAVGGNSTQTLDVTECVSYTSPGNQVWTMSGIYNETIPSSMGCDSTFVVNLTIEKFDQAINFSSLSSVVYGASDFTLNATSDSGLSPTYSSLDPSVATVSGTTVSIVGVGTTTITASQVGDACYNSAMDVSQGLTVNKASLTATADDQTLSYGDVLTTAITYTGFVNGEDGSVLDTAPMVTGSGTDVGTYSLLASGGVDNNYAFSYADGVLTIEKGLLTATGDDQSIIYGDVSPKFTITYSGFVNSEDESVLDTAPMLTVSGSNAGVYSVTVSGGSDDNYEIDHVNGVFTINKAPLMVIVDDQSIVYGDASPMFTFTYSGFVNGEDESMLGTEPTLTASGTDAGTYSISASVGVDENYDFNYIDAIFTIGKVSIIATADNQTVSYGAMLIPLITYTGFVNGEDGSVLDTAPMVTGSGTDVGTYSLLASGGVDNNYDFSYVDGLLNIEKALLIATANDENIVFGETPTHIISYIGFMNGEDESVIDTTPNITGSGTDTGTYVISISGGLDNNYDFDYVNGVLRISQMSAIVTINDLLHIADGIAKEVVVITDPVGLNVIVTYDGASTLPIDAGSYDVVATIDEMNFSGSTTAILLIELVTGVFDQLSDNEIVMYPNPSNEYVHISLGDGQSGHLQIVDSKSQIVKTISQYNSEDRININELQAGVYLLQIRLEQHIEYVKFIKQ